MGTDSIDSPHPHGRGIAGASVTRRRVLAGSIGAGVLLALPWRATAAAAATESGTSGAGAAPQAFIYGIQASDVGPSLQAAGSSAPSSATSSLPEVATQLAALPVKSPDQSMLALVTVAEPAAGMTVTVTLVDTVSAASPVLGTLKLPAYPPGTMLLVTPVFAADNKTIALVLSVTIPSNQGQVTKRPTATGEIMTLNTATWTSHHELAYFDRDTASFAGPFDLADAPSLAHVTAIADQSDLFLWTVDEASAVMRPKTGGKPSPSNRPVTRLAAYPLGSGTPRFSVAAPGPWPGSGDPVVLLPGGGFARLAYARQVEVYSATTGQATEILMPALTPASTRPAKPAMETRPDGTVFINKPAIGRAVIADPARSFQELSVISYPVPASPGGAPAGKAALSSDGKTLYVLGGASTGGLSTYDVATGAMTATYTDGQQFTGLHQLAGGTLIAFKPTSPKMTFFTPALVPAGTADTSLYVAAVA